MGVDVTGQNEFAFNIDNARTFWNRCRDLISEIGNAIAIDQNPRVGDDSIVCRINQCTADECDLLGMNRQRPNSDNDQTKQRFHKQIIVAALVSSAETKNKVLGTSTSTTAQF